MIACGTSINLDSNILLSNLPLFEQSQIEVIEWSYDALQGKEKLPPWFYDLLQEYSKAGKLVGHGIFYSLFKAKWDRQQDDYLDFLYKVLKSFQFDHITEHFGFMSGVDFHKGAPLPIPMIEASLAIGYDRLDRLSQVAQCPVGLENLAISYHIEDVIKHGDFLEKLASKVNGFIILDLHNVYCQSKNFDLNLDALVDMYPLHLVREIHLSGGSWQASQTTPSSDIRRDTHDDSVPQDLLDYLPLAIKKCPNLKYIILEQLGEGLKNEESKKRFQEDFLKIKNIVSSLLWQFPTKVNNFTPPYLEISTEPIDDLNLYEDQLQIIHVFESSNTLENIINAVPHLKLYYEWQPEAWKPTMVEAIWDIVQKWK